MPGPPPKREGRQRTNTSELATVTRLDRTVSVPTPSPRWSSSTVEEWESAWSSELGSYWLDTTDVSAIRRLFDLRDRLRTVEDELDREGLVSIGSTGQIVAHPLVKIGDTIRAQILALEDRTGLSPMARLKLGVKVGEAAKSLDALNERLRRNGHVQDDDVEVDPRNVIDLPS